MEPPDLIKLKFNPLSPEFFPNSTQLCDSAHATFADAPLPQRSLLWGQTWWDKCTWRVPSGNAINDIHDHPGAKQLGVKDDIGLIPMQNLS